MPILPRVFRVHTADTEKHVITDKPITNNRPRALPTAQRPPRANSHGGAPTPAPRLPTALEARRAALLARLLVVVRLLLPLLLPARGERPEARAELIDREAARDPELGQRRVVSLTLEQHRACGVTRIEVRVEVEVKVGVEVGVGVRVGVRVRATGLE